MGPEHLEGRIAHERWLAVEGLVEDARERVEVGSGVDGLPGDVLGREVVERADELTGIGQSAGSSDLPGEPEVCEVAVLLARVGRDQELPGFTSRWTRPRA